MAKAIDLAIVGSGAAGLAAAIYAVRRNLKVRVFEKEALGGQTALAIWVENYPGFKRIGGEQLMRRWAEHLAGLGLGVEEANGVESVEKASGGFELVLESGERVKAKAVLLCTGTENKRLGAPGEKEFYGKGVSYCANCDGPFFKGKTVAVVGAGNSGVTNALYLNGMCKKTYLVEFLSKPNCDEIYLPKLERSGIQRLYGHELIEILGSENVSAIKVKERASGKVKEIKVDAVFIYVGLMPRSELAKQLGCRLDEKGFVKVDDKNMTSVHGVFAAGDLRSNALAQTIWAAGDGAKAALEAYNYLKGLE